MRIRYTEVAWLRLSELPPEQREQAKRLIRAIVLADTTIGRPWNRDLEGRLYWIASALDTHIVYRIAFRQFENTLYVVNVLVFSTPTDPNNS